MKSLFPDICSTNLQASKEFYLSLLNFKVVFEIDWYIQLQSPTDENLQIAFVQQNHNSVPKSYQKSPQGVVITVETDNVDLVYDKANNLQLPLALELRDEEWGQRHFMCVDPNGLLVDIVTMIEPTVQFLNEHGLST